MLQPQLMATELPVERKRTVLCFLSRILRRALNRVPCAASSHHTSALNGKLFKDLPATDEKVCQGVVEFRLDLDPESAKASRYIACLGLHYINVKVQNLRY